MARREITLDGAKSVFRATFGRALASAAVTAIDNASAEGRPLTQLQQIDVVTMIVMAYGEAEREATTALEMEAVLLESVYG